jgi:serine acetyltransferase
MKAILELYWSDYEAHCEHKPPESERRRRLLALPRLLANPALRATLMLRFANASPRYTWWLWRNVFVALYAVDWIGPFEVGPRFEFSHPVATVVAAQVRLGSDVDLGQNVTIGGDADGNVPVIGDRVTIYPGAVIVGNLTVGDDSVIGANTVVHRDVPAEHIVTTRGMRPLGSADRPEPASEPAS